MATLVLTAVGTVVGSPIFGLAAAGLGLGQALFGSSGRREGTRLSDLAVQSSAYGAVLPRIYGRMRVAGSVIWATDIQESSQNGGGGKGKPKTTTYSYSVSLAIALSARPIRAIGRVWADGKLIRNADGDWLVPAAMRLHDGSDNRAPDPLIASAEGGATTPAYRGIAYVVFDDLDLTSFANHIPSFSFEVDADAGPASAGLVLDDLCAGMGFSPATNAEVAMPMTGFAISSSSTIRDVASTLLTIDDFVLLDDGNRAGFSFDVDSPTLLIDEADIGASGGTALDGDALRMTIERFASDTLPGEVDVSYCDIDRDYQTGLQRVLMDGGGATQRLDLPAALAAVDAKSLARRRLLRARAGRTTATLSLPYRNVTTRPGDRVRDPVHGLDWRVREWTVENHAVQLMLEREGGVMMPVTAADGGRSAAQLSLPNGPTVLDVLDLPPLFDELPVAPRLWVAAAGATEGWRRADVAWSADDGASWQSLFTATGASVIGRAVTLLPAGSAALWDDAHGVDVELMHDGMWLEGRSDESLLAGGNLALLGTELVQFGAVQSLGNRRFRLSHLLRGRRGTETAMPRHEVGERFILIDPALLGSFDAPVSLLGGRLLFRATGPGEAPDAVSPVALTLSAVALKPPSPVHLHAARQADGSILIRWMRRSRQGWAWLDGVDAPLGEEGENYRLSLRLDGAAERIATVTSPTFIYSVMDQEADGGGGSKMIEMRVSQISALVGPGEENVRKLPV